MLYGRWPLILLLLLLPACSDDDPTVPEGCDPATSAVDVHIDPAEPVVFDWSPRCGVVMLLVEEEASGSDVWGAIVPEDESAVWSDPAKANLIEPPVTFGEVPDVAEMIGPPGQPGALMSGVAYDVALWRIMPDIDAADCIAKSENACLVAVRSFTR